LSGPKGPYLKNPAVQTMFYPLINSRVHPKLDTFIYSFSYNFTGYWSHSLIPSENINLLKC